MALSVAGLWRYSIKMLAGEALQSAELTPGGLRYDRIVHVRGPEGVLIGGVDGAARSRSPRPLAGGRSLRNLEDSLGFGVDSALRPAAAQ